VKTTYFELQSIGTETEPSGLAKACPNSDPVELAASPNAASSSTAHLTRKATFRFRGVLNLFTVNAPLRGYPVLETIVSLLVPSQYRVLTSKLKCYPCSSKARGVLTQPSNALYSHPLNQCLCAEQAIFTLKKRDRG
jgi:hypothetical protein